MLSLQIATNHELRETIEMLEAKLKKPATHGQLNGLHKELEDSKARNEHLEAKLNVANQNGDNVNALEQQVKTLEEALQRAPSIKHVNSLRERMDDLQTENRNMQGRLNRLNSERETRKQEIKALKVKSSSITSQQATEETEESRHFRKPQGRVVEDPQDKKSDGGRDFEEILSSNPSQSAGQDQDENEAVSYVEGIWPMSPDVVQSGHQQEESRISLPRKKPVRVQSSSVRTHSSSTPLSSQGGDDRRQLQRSKAMPATIASVPRLHHQSDDDPLESQETVSTQQPALSQRSSHVAVPPKLIARKEDGPLPISVRRILERIAYGASNLKRDLDVADLEARTVSGSKRVRTKPSSQLGPVVADSQSPDHLLNGRGRKISSSSTRRSSYKGQWSWRGVSYFLLT